MSATGPGGEPASGADAVARLRAQIAGDGLLAPGRPVVVLYSGGRDSTCLLHLATTIAGAPAVRALHVDYGLRGGASAADARHCAAVCAALDVPLQVHAPPAPPAGNLQAWARAQRYQRARALADGGDAEAAADIATGHTATDQVETILYRLASSPSRRALLGMRPRQGGLVRPLLELTRAQTTAYCRAAGLSWCEDDSNTSDAYARNRVRHELVPALERAHPAAQRNVLALAQILADEAQVLDATVDGLLDGDERIALATLRRQPPALRRLIVQRLADAAAGTPAAGVARRAPEVAALPDAGVAALDLPHGVRAIAERGILRFERTPPRPT